LGRVTALQWVDCMHSSDNVYAERGLGQRQGAGVAPALVVVDLNYAFTAPQSPLHCSADEAVRHRLAARRRAGRRTAGGLHHA